MRCRRLRRSINILRVILWRVDRKYQEIHFAPKILRFRAYLLLSRKETIGVPDYWAWKMTSLSLLVAYVLGKEIFSPKQITASSRSVSSTGASAAPRSTRIARILLVSTDLQYACTYSMFSEGALLTFSSAQHTLHRVSHLICLYYSIALITLKSAGALGHQSAETNGSKNCQWYEGALPTVSFHPFQQCQ